jgi:hypothetical protein
VVVLYTAWLIPVRTSSHLELPDLMSLSRYLLLLIVSCLTMAALAWLLLVGVIDLSMLDDAG